MGLWGLYFGYIYGYRARFLIPSFFMMMVGVGSVFFHVGKLQLSEPNQRNFRSK